MVPRSGRARAGRSRRRRVLRAEHAEVRADPDLDAPCLSALLARVPARDEEFAGRENLGAWPHRLAPRHRPPEDSVHRAPSGARGNNVPHGAGARRGDPDCRRRRRVGDAHRRHGPATARRHIDLGDRGRDWANSTIFPSPNSRLGKSSAEEPPRLAQGWVTENETRTCSRKAISSWTSKTVALPACGRAIAYVFARYLPPP